MRKIKTGLVLLLLLVFAIAIAGCLESKSQPQDEKGKMADKIPPAPEETQGVVVPVAHVETVKCELCHTNADKLGPHIDGGKLCINCHGSQVHSIHIGTGTVNLQCDSCHGFPPKVPKVEKGEGPGHYSICENCHAAPPDSLNASNGDLIEVHLSRAKYCTNCHGTDVGVTHEAVLNRSAKK